MTIIENIYFGEYDKVTVEYILNELHKKKLRMDIKIVKV